MMLDFDRLLVPVDFSHDSLAALEYALALARKLNGSQTVIALYVVDEGLPAALASSSLASQGSAESERQQKKTAINQLQKFVATLDPGEEKLEIDVVIGRPASEEICKYAALNKIDMIVIGAQGKGALRRLVLGSTMQQVQRFAPCPVLGVKDPSALTSSK
jgi:nucleotide-binding universal stress UspA family protein